MVPLLQPVTVLHLRATDRRIVNRVKAGGGGYSWARQMCEHRQRQAGGGGGRRPARSRDRSPLGRLRAIQRYLAAHGCVRPHRRSATRRGQRHQGATQHPRRFAWQQRAALIGGWRPASAAKRSTWLPPPEPAIDDTRTTVILAAAVEAERRRQAVCAQVAGTHQPHGQALLCADVLFFRPPHRNARGADALDAHLRGSGVRRAARLSALRPSGRRSGRCRR